MCGYARRHISSRQLHELADLFNEAGLVIKRGVEELVHFYPAFGGNPTRLLNDLVIRQGAGLATVDATWWFDCRENGESLTVNNQRTTFNARNLASPYWRGAIRHHRGVLITTGIGEGKMIDGKSRHYLVESDQPLLLGCVYRSYPNGCYSAAIITRDSHPRFEPYHDRAFPLILPRNEEFLRLWLSDAREDNAVIADILNNPRIFNDLRVTPVKTFKEGVPLGETERLLAD